MPDLSEWTGPSVKDAIVVLGWEVKLEKLAKESLQRTLRRQPGSKPPPHLWRKPAARKTGLWREVSHESEDVAPPPELAALAFDGPTSLAF